MTLQVTGKNLDVGEALRGYVVSRIEHTLDKYVGGSHSGRVLIEKEHGAFRTDCSVHLQTGLNLQSHGEAANAYASADLALERLDKRLRRYKRRLKRRHVQPASDPQSSAPYYVIQKREDEQEEPEDDNPVIIAETQTVIRELSVSDAVMQMDLLDEPLVVFRHPGHRRINVVYRRPDGNIGWVDPGGETAGNT